MLNRKLATETKAKMKALGNSKSLLTSFKRRLQDMKQEYDENVKSMANKTVHLQNEMRDEHKRREAESRRFFHHQNEQNYHNLAAYYEDKISALSNQIIQRDTELHTIYKNRIQGLTEVNDDLHNRLAYSDETEPPNTLEPGCEHDETGQAAQDIFSSFAQTLFENEPQDNQQTERRPSKKRKRHPSQSSMHLKQDEDQSVDEDKSDCDTAYL